MVCSRRSKRIKFRILGVILAGVLGCSPLTACQTTEPVVHQAATLDRESLLRQIHKVSASIQSATTKIQSETTTQNRFFTIQDSLAGTYLYSYDASRSLVGAQADLQSSEGREQLIWLPTNGYIRRDDNPWETSTQYPNQTYSLVNAYSIFSKLESRMSLLPVESHPELVEFYYDSDSRSGMEILSGLGSVPLQQLPLTGLRAIVHFFFQRESGQLQQLALQIDEPAQSKTWTQLSMLFYDVNQEVRMTAPELGSDTQESAPTELLNEAERWNHLSQLLDQAQLYETYQMLKDVQYIYNVPGQTLRGHNVDQVQVVQQNGNYFLRGDRRIQNDRANFDTEVYQIPSGVYTGKPGSWNRIQDGTPKSPVSTLIYDLLSLNQGLTASRSQGKTVYSYSGTNQLFFVLCNHLFEMDLRDLRNQKIQIDLDFSIEDHSSTPHRFRIRLRSPYNDTLDLTGEMQFLNYNEQPKIEAADVQNSEAAGQADTRKGPADAPRSGVSVESETGYQPGGMDGPAPGEGIFEPAPEHRTQKEGGRE